MTRHVLVVGHSDADGHAIAEQVRRNLSLIPDFDVHVLVDPRRTRGHQSWLTLEELVEVADADIIFFVDLMFSPMQFHRECESFVKFANKYDDKMFFVVDHHPLPIRCLSSAPNVRLAYRPEVFECTIGPRSGLMILAAICERQRDLIGEIRQPYHDVLALGLRRAAAPGGNLAGTPLMKLLAAGRWDILYELGADDAAFHRLVRGRRVATNPPSEKLTMAEQTAKGFRESFLNDKMSPSGHGDSGRTAMPYDAALERYVLERDHPARYRNEANPSNDLEALVTLLEVAALSLTQSPDSTFSREQLMVEARAIGGSSVEINERDVKIVLEKASFVQRAGLELRLK